MHPDAKPSKPLKTDAWIPLKVQATLRALPLQPGSYQFYDAEGALLYVGKAKSLRQRVRSYFAPSRKHTERIEQMVQQVAEIRFTTTRNETEALLLEANLIATHQPHYNVLLRHEFRYPWLGVSLGAFPRLFVTRSPVKGTARAFYGPYLNTQSLFELLKVLRKYFPLRQRRFPLFKDRPCMNYTLKLCPGSCQGLITPEAYQVTLAQLDLFLKGHTELLAQQLTQEMYEASERLAFEHAAVVKERLALVQKTVAKQAMIDTDPTRSVDVYALVHTPEMTRVMIARLVVRRGKLIASEPHSFQLQGQTSVFTQQALWLQFIIQHYQDKSPEDIPSEVALADELSEDAIETLSRFLHKIKGKKVKLTTPKRGIQKELLAIAMQNAKKWFEDALISVQASQQYDPMLALMQLQEELALQEFPQRIECYDISHFQGKQTVASMVVFTEGVPDRQAYRRFKIQVAEGMPDDFASMREVIARRLTHLDDWGEPDLLVIDGGKGQLSAAYGVLSSAGMTHIPMISLAKRLEEIFQPHQSESVRLSHRHPALMVLQRLRDEAHRFAITYHRQLREKKAVVSQLDEIPGIGPVRRKKLYTYFKTLPAMKKSTPETMAGVLGVSVPQAEKILDALRELS
ncbi:MAG: excinuclease ABC subunit UvrC [Vampirovibrionales bacterium]